MSTQISDILMAIFLVGWIGIILWFGLDVIIGYAKGHRFEDENEEEVEVIEEAGWNSLE